jgi:uncharacterized protein YjiS (DUF1127 family)
MFEETPMPEGLPLRAEPSVAARIDAPAAAAARADSSLRHLLRWLLGRLRHSGRRLTAAHELHGLNDRLLRDMGVERDEIDATVEDLLARDEAAAKGPRREPVKM